VSRPTQPAPKPLDYRETFAHFDAIDNAKGNLVGTIAVVSALIGDDQPLDNTVAPTLQRYLHDDVAALEAAFAAAHEAILSPLHAVAFPNEGETQ